MSLIKACLVILTFVYVSDAFMYGKYGANNRQLSMFAPQNQQLMMILARKNSQAFAGTGMRLLKAKKRAPLSVPKLPDMRDIDGTFIQNLNNNKNLNGVKSLLDNDSNNYDANENEIARKKSNSKYRTTNNRYGYEEAEEKPMRKKYPNNKYQASRNYPRKSYRYDE